MNWFRYLIMAIAMDAALLVYRVSSGLGVNNEAGIVLGIMILAGILWFTEALPLHATGLLIAFLLIISGVFTTKEAFAPFFDPVIVLLLGGFVLARAMQKHGLDKKIAYSFLAVFGNKPGPFLFGLMLVTAFLSMWMTNTATTALLLPIAIVVLSKSGLKPKKSSYAKAVVLGIAFAATIGGIGTLVGSTPNPMAAKFLADEGIALDFVGWMVHALPLVIVLLPVAWFVLMQMYKPEVTKLKIDKQKPGTTKNQKLVLLVFVSTVLLWLTTSFHGFSSPVVSVVPILLLYFFNLVDTQDFSKINWAALVLFGGGLSLGLAVQATGLDSIFAKVIQNFALGQPYFLILVIVATVSILLTLVSSNTATAAVLIPIAIPLSVALGVDVKIMTVLAAIGVSLDFIVPVGTPPSTIAYSSGYITVKDMAKPGIIIALIGVLAVATLAFFYWPLL
ncbi:DASS family sodium-coupled anion symporter [archaeon]|nr:DASS family sodium-coupled anion symporter [archaeon]